MSTFPSALGFAHSDRSRVGNDARSLLYNVSRGDAIAQDTVLHPVTIRIILDKLAAYGGDLAYSPAIQASVNNVLKRRYETNEGNDLFCPPNYAVYEDPEVAAFHGVDVSMVDNIQTRKETHLEIRDRLIEEVVREVEPELAGLAQMMNHYENESWARHGVADEKLFVHADPNRTLFRNPGGGWCAVDNPVATSDKGNVINMFEGQPEYTFPTPHPGWEIDRS